MSVLSFVKQMWPELSIWHFYMGILNYQINFDSLQKLKKENEEMRKHDLLCQSRMVVIENRKELVDKIKISASTSSELTDATSSAANLKVLAKTVAVEAVDNCIKQHNGRVSAFLADLYAERMGAIHTLASTSCA